MKIKCNKCWHKNEKDSYKCGKCWEIFRQSEEKYKEFLKKEKEDIQKEDIQRYPLDEPEVKVIKYKQVKRACRVPFVFWILYAWKSINEVGGQERILILIILRWLVLTLILLWFKKIIIKYAEKRHRSELFVEVVIFILLALGFLRPYMLGILLSLR